MKKILTMTFTSVDAFRKVRDLVENSPEPLPNWRYEFTKNGVPFIEFFNPTTAEFFFRLGADITTQKITGVELNGTAEAARENSGAGKAESGK